MHVQDEISTRIQAPRHVRGLLDGRRPGLPEQEVAIGLEGIGFDSNIHTVEPRGAIGAVASAKRPIAIHKYVGVMDHASVARSNFDRSYVPCTVDLGRQDEVTENVATFGRKGVWA